MDIVLTSLQREGLGHLSLKTGLSMSDLIRRAIDEHLLSSGEIIPLKAIPDSLSKVLQLFDYLGGMLEIPHDTVVLPFETVMIHFNLKWNECKNLVRAMCSLLEIRGIDVIWEPIYDESDSNDSRDRDKVGFRLQFSEMITKDEIRNLRDDILLEYQKTGSAVGDCGGRTLKDYK